MVILTFNEAILLINTMLISFALYSIYQYQRYHNSMEEASVRHFVSHWYIGVMFLIAINLFFYKGWVTPIVFSVSLIVLHLMKENNRLVKEDRWESSVEGGYAGERRKQIKGE